MEHISYEHLEETCSLLSDLIKRKEVVNKRANEEKGTTLMKEVLKAYATVNAICQVVNNQFSELRNDFTGNKIKLDQYRNHLKPLKKLISKHKFDNECLHNGSIKTEVDLFLKN